MAGDRLWRDDMDDAARAHEGGARALHPFQFRRPHCLFASYDLRMTSSDVRTLSDIRQPAITTSASRAGTILSRRERRLPSLYEFLLQNLRPPT
jgi:hypothetical protein